MDRLLVSPIITELFLQEFLETLESVSTFVVDWFLAFSLWIVVNSWESFNDNTWNFVLGSVNLSDDKFFSEVSKLFSEFQVVFGELIKLEWL